MSFIHDDFLLSNETARRLYHEYAEGQPILDYHCHLPPPDLAENRQLSKTCSRSGWRATITSGAPCGPTASTSGSAPGADPYQKFLAWARTVPHTLRNPLYHWTHLELKRYFGIAELLDESSAQRIWDRANELLATEELRAQGILGKFHVAALCTTDDATDDLACHKALAASGLATKVFPAFRPDKAFNVHLPELFNPGWQKLEAISGVSISSFHDFVDALARRHDFFHQMGGRLSDHGLNCVFADFCDEKEAGRHFRKGARRPGGDTRRAGAFCGFLLLEFGRWDAAKGWTKQLHLGARRNNNTRRYQELGPDVGFDSIGDWPQADALANYMDRLDRESALPKMVLYNLNPADNYVLATMIGNFQDGAIAGKIQFGSGWWFLDQKEAMTWQMNALSNCGLISRFIGMITDSRSFMSYPRHEYFRRVLCDLFGKDMEAGELPNSDDLVGPMIRNICYGNALQFLGLGIT
jgi:glucuronate isomerase